MKTCQCDDPLPYQDGTLIRCSRCWKCLNQPDKPKRKPNYIRPYGGMKRKE